MNNKGQAAITGLIFLIIIVMLITSFMPVFKTMLNNARHSDSLNCASNINVCNDGETAIPCYNSSLTSETTSCLILDMFLPLLILVVLIGGAFAVIQQKSTGSPFGQQQYGGYQ